MKLLVNATYNTNARDRLNRFAGSLLKTHWLVLVVCCLSLSSCGFLHRNTIGLFSSPDEPTEEKAETATSFESAGVHTESDEPHTTTVEIEKLEKDKPSDQKSEIEIVWEIPEQPVEGYFIHYGFSRENLDKIVKLKTAEIERYEDPRYGFVYRHRLTGIPADSSIFVAMATYEGSTKSSLSDVFEVAPGS